MSDFVHPRREMRRIQAKRASALRRLALVSALVLAAGATTVVAASSEKRPVEGVAGSGGTAQSHAFAPIAPGASRILVTFSDAPRRAEAGRRLGDLGAVVPVLPEAGVWGLSPTDPTTARESALRRERVDAAEWSLAHRIAELPAPGPPIAPSGTPAFTDPYFVTGAQWGLLPTGGTWGSDLTVTGRRPTIAILDTGVDPTHEEWGGPASPLVAPRSTVRRNSDASDWGDEGHGTHVAGIAAAPANGVGIVGVAPGVAGAAPVIPVQVATREGYSSDETNIRGIRHAVTNGAKVINISAGGQARSRAFQDTVLWATQRGALIVASVGNEGSAGNQLNYPAAYPRVLGVGAQCDDQPSQQCPRPFGVARFSNHNRSVDVIAPGVDVLSSVPKRVVDGAVAPGYGLKDGTSMSTPYVTGVAALVMAANDGALSPWQVLRQIENTATDTGATGRDPFSGAGVVNPRAAVTLPAPPDDTDEVNDDVKWVGAGTALAEVGEPRLIDATIDRNDDPDDVYPVTLKRGERLRIVLRRPRGRMDLYLWRPGTGSVSTDRPAYRRDLLRFRAGKGSTTALVYRAARSGRHFIDVYGRTGGGAYTLSITRGG